MGIRKRGGRKRDSIRKHPSSSRVSHSIKKREKQSDTLKVIRRKRDKILYNMLDVDEETKERILHRIKAQIIHIREFDGQYEYVNKEGEKVVLNLETIVDDTIDEIVEGRDDVATIIRDMADTQEEREEIAEFTDEQLTTIAIDDIKEEFRSYTSDMSWTKDLFYKLWLVGDREKERNAVTVLEGTDSPRAKGSIDLWTIRHYIGSFLIGLVFPNMDRAFVGKRSAMFFGGGVAFEIGEEKLSEKSPDASSASETIGNKGTDLVANQLGYETGSAIRKALTRDPHIVQKMI